MADPAKLAALQEYAETGSFPGAQQALGQSKDEALARQSSLGDLTGAPTRATAGTMPTIEQPYGRFNTALQEYQGAYDQSAATLGAANDQYMAQVADAQAAHRAEANRAIAEAQAAAARRSGSDSGYEDLSQWEIEARATGLGNEYQETARGEAERERGTASKLEQGVMGAQEAINKANLEATEDEKFRAAQQWDSEHPGVQVIGDEAAMAEKEQWIDEWAGSDRLGAPKSQRQAALDASTTQRDAHAEDPFANPYGSGLSNTFDAREQFLADYIGPQFKRQAAMDLQLLGPDIPPELAEIQFAGMFPEATADEEMDAAEARRKRAYFEETGFESPQDEQSWAEAERKRAGLPSLDSRQVRRAEDPGVARDAGLRDEDVIDIRSSEKWETALQQVENALAGGEDESGNPIPAVMSPGQLKMTLEEARDVGDRDINEITDEEWNALPRLIDDERMIRLLIAMYGPSLVG